MIQSKQDLKFYIAEDRKRNLRADSNMSKWQLHIPEHVRSARDIEIV